MGAMTARAIPSAVVVYRKGQPPVHAGNQMGISVLANGKRGKAFCRKCGKYILYVWQVEVELIVLFLQNHTSKGGRVVRHIGH